MFTLRVQRGGGGGWDDPQMFFKHKSANKQPKPAKFLLIQVW